MDTATANRLSKVHPELRKRVEKLLTNLSNLGMDVRAVQGLRTIAEQDALFAQGRSKPGNKVTNARGGQSNHNYGLAVDLCPFEGGKPDWNDTKAFKAIGREAKAVDLEWGGDWKFVDMPHVQLRGMSVKECQAAYRQGGLPAVWSRMYQILGGAPATQFVPKEDELLEFGDKGEEVKKLQRDLLVLGFLHAHEIDGHFGKVTKNAVIAFQRQNSLTADGIVGPGTKAKLKAALSAKAKVFNNLQEREIDLAVSAASPSIPVSNAAVETDNRQPLSDPTANQPISGAETPLSSSGEADGNALSEQIPSEQHQTANQASSPETQIADQITNVSTSETAPQINAAQSLPTTEVVETKPTGFGKKLAAFFTAIFTGQYIVPQFLQDGLNANSTNLIVFIGKLLQGLYDNRYLVFTGLALWYVVKKINNAWLTSKIVDTNADPTKGNVVLVKREVQPPWWEGLMFWR